MAVPITSGCGGEAGKFEIVGFGKVG